MSPPNPRLWIVVAAVAGIGSVAYAQSRTVLLLEEEVIKGEVQKPTVTLFVTRQNINTDATLELRESFVPRIIESVEKKPF
jgi:predicted NACHT family NTPase